MTNYKLDMQKRDKVGSNAVRKLRVKEMVQELFTEKT